jgi:uncharacterized protein YjbI with pentapeptide repeats
MRGFGKSAYAGQHLHSSQPGGRFQGWNFQDAKLHKLDLRGADFRDTDLRGATFWECDLRGADLSHVNGLAEKHPGRETSFLGCDMRGAILDGARLSGAVLGHRYSFHNQSPPYTATDLSAASLRGTQLRGANLHGVSFRGANVSGADLSEANMTGAKAIGALIIGAVMDGAHLRGSDFSGAVGGSLEQFQGARLISANMNHHALRTKPARLPEAIAQEWLVQLLDSPPRSEEPGANRALVGRASASGV